MVKDSGSDVPLFQSHLGYNCLQLVFTSVMGIQYQKPGNTRGDEREDWITTQVAGCIKINSPTKWSFPVQVPMSWHDYCSGCKMYPMRGIKQIHFLLIWSTSHNVTCMTLALFWSETHYTRYVSANTTLQKYDVYISVFTASFLCSPKTAPVVVLHTEAKVLLLSQNGSDWSARPPLTFLEGERSAG